MGEDRDRDRVRARGEVDMNKAGQERQAVGLLPEEAREINEPRESKSKSRSKINAAANVLAAGLTAAAGVGLAATAQEALNSAPAPIAEQAPELDPLSRRPPEGVVFPQSPRADGSTGPSATSSGPSGSPLSAPVEPVLTKRVFIPRALKDISGQKLDEAERPLWPAEFGAPERGITLFNRGVEKGVKLGDQQLFENLMYLREKYGRPDLKLEIYFYDSVVQMNLSGVSVSLQRERIPYNFWAKNIRILDDEGNFLYLKSYPDTTKDGVIRFDIRRDTILTIHVSLPELLPGVTLDSLQTGEIEAGMSNEIVEDAILLNGDGQPSVPVIYPNTEVARDFSTHQAVIRSQNGRPLATAIKLAIK